jgi:hypothetical protein
MYAGLTALVGCDVASSRLVVTNACLVLGANVDVSVCRGTYFCVSAESRFVGAGAKIVCDFTALLGPGKRRNSSREEGQDSGRESHRKKSVVCE